MSTPAALGVYKDAVNVLEQAASSDEFIVGAAYRTGFFATHARHDSGFLPEIPREIGMVSSHGRVSPDGSSIKSRNEPPRSASMPSLRTGGNVRGSTLRAASKTRSGSGPNRDGIQMGAGFDLVVDAARARKANAQAARLRSTQDSEPAHKSLVARAMWRKAHVLTKLDTTMRKPRLRHEAPAWWDPLPVRVVEAADLFDRRIRTRAARAERLSLVTKRDELAREHLRDAVFDVASTRYRTNTPVELVRAAEKRRERIEQVQVDHLVDQFAAPSFDLYASIWGARCDFADSRDVYDNDETDMKRFRHDWERCLRLGVATLITRHDDDPGKDEDGDGIPDEVVEVGTVLWQNHDAVCLIFAYYASMGGDISTIGLNQWSLFLEDFKLVQRKSKFCKRADMDRIFIAVDTASARLEAQDMLAKKKKGVASDEKKKELNRVEFITCLANIAINKYILPGEMDDVSEAMKRLLEIDIQSRMNPGLLADPNSFREAHCYTPEVSEYLRAKEKSLRTLFAVICGGGRGIESQLLDLNEWKEFMRGCGLISIDLTERDVTLAFVWSRTTVIDCTTPNGHRKECNLPFEGFLEALCRASIMKSLPTQEEIYDANCRDAAEYLEQLKTYNMVEYENFMEERATPWGDSPAQPTEICMKMLVSIIIHSIEKMCGSGAGNGEIDHREATKFWKAAQKAHK